MPRYRVTMTRPRIHHEYRDVWVNADSPEEAEYKGVRMAQPSYLSNTPNDNDTGWQFFDTNSEDVEFGEVTEALDVVVDEEGYS